MTVSPDGVVIGHMPEAFIDIVRRLLPLPTAPYHEHHVIEEVRRFASQRSLSVEADEFGNLSLSVGLSVLHRFSMLLWSLFGGVFLFLSRREAREAMREAQTMDPSGS